MARWDDGTPKNAPRIERGFGHRASNYGKVQEPRMQNRGLGAQLHVYLYFAEKGQPSTPGKKATGQTVTGNDGLELEKKEHCTGGGGACLEAEHLWRRLTWKLPSRVWAILVILVSTVTAGENAGERTVWLAKRYGLIRGKMSVRTV